MSYSVNLLYGGDSGTVISDLTLDEARQTVSDFMSDYAQPLPADAGWSIWDGAVLIESGPNASA